MLYIFIFWKFHIVYTIFITDNLEYLYQLLSQFETPDMSQNSIKVPNWSIQGQIFLDYIDIKDKVMNLIFIQFLQQNIIYLYFLLIFSLKI